MRVPPFILSPFLPTAIDSYGTQHLAIDLAAMHPATTWAVTKFSYSLLRVCLSDFSSRVLNLFYTFTVFSLLIPLFANEDQSYRVDLLVCFLFQPRIRRIIAETILWSKDTPSKEEYASQFKASGLLTMFLNHLGWCRTIGLRNFFLIYRLSM